MTLWLVALTANAMSFGAHAVSAEYGWMVANLAACTIAVIGIHDER